MSEPHEPHEPHASLAARPLESQLALVTGASRGIGRAIALTLGAAGATVIGTATSADGAERIGADLRAAGVAGRGAVWRAAEAGATEALAEQLQAAEGLPTILVNNAGIAHDALILRMKSEDWEQTLSVNLSAVFRLTKLCVRRMLKERHGRIVNIGSVVGSIGNAGQAHYSAAKAGLIGFSKALARELATRNITVNTVAPGFIETDMTRSLPEAQRAAYLAQIPMGRFGNADEVAQAVLFLTTRQAGYITGQTLHVNGGMYMG
ncbi:MAG TPA: 3-oxoacyl-ACP reductase FabG [Steroidobacteraceae bacterium]|jgi:3-oxoacyl-[acyl-carrier protein] reductase|nr:3-oxoacyl-ACP reductase FabG [Steroidobacteraceae bacterium]